MIRRDRVVPLGTKYVPPEQPQDSGAGGTGSSIDLIYLWSVLRTNLRTIVAITLVCVVAMLFHVMSTTPIYTAYARVLLDTRQERVTPAEEVVSNLDVTASVIAGEVVTIQSNVLLGEVVDALDLVNEPVLDPRTPRPESTLAWLKRMARGGEPAHVRAQRRSPEELRAQVVDTLRQGLSVQQMGLAYVIGISFRSPDPVLAAKVTNAVAEGYIASQLDDKLSASVRANAWLSDRLVELSEQVQSSDGAVVDFRAEMIDRADGSEESIAQLLNELNSRLVESATARADAEVRLSQVEALRDSGGLAAVSDVVSSPLLETLQQERAQLAAQQAQMASTLGRRHPDMVRITAQIADVDRSLQTELNRRVEEMRSEVIVTRNRVDALRGQIAVISERADGLARDSVRLSQLERSAEATRLVYENFLARFKETSAQADFQTPEARVIGQAKVPTSPSEPKKSLMMIAAFGMGLSGAIAWVFLRNLTRAPISTPDELREITRRPMLAMLPNVRHLGPRFMWLRRELKANGGSSYMEHVNTIRSALFTGQGRNAPRTVLVTSSIPNEGKTSLGCSLARSLVNSGKSVVLLDADLRRPDVRKALKLSGQGACLVDYLEGNVKVKDLVIQTDIEKLDVVAPKRASARAADLLGVPQFDGLLTRLASSYDVVVVNAPPVLYLSDAVMLAEKSDATIFCVQCGQTPARVVRGSIQRLQNAGVTVTGTVLTRVRPVHAAARETEMYAYDY